MKRKYLMLGLAVLLYFFALLALAHAEEIAEKYTLGVGDVLDINILEPEKINNTAVVMPDGTISFPYIGSVYVKELTLSEIQETVQKQLADGYLKYPVVSVSLKDARSRRFFVYGEVIRPGAYPLEENMTVLKAISIAGGFTKYGSVHVKILRPQTAKAGYQTIKVNINAVMNGSNKEDTVLRQGDIVVVSEGIL